MKPTFEQAYERLEKILTTLSSGEVLLEDSLKYYEEADKLMKLCSEHLSKAEQKIQTLIKNRDGSAALNENGAPQMEPFGC